MIDEDEICIFRVPSRKYTDSRLATLLKFQDTMIKSQTANSEPPSTRATYQDVLDAPPHMVAEIVDGTLYTQPRPGPVYCLASTVLRVCIGSHFHRGRSGPGDWWNFGEPEIHLGEDVLVPNIAGWRRERMLEFPTTDYFTLAPDWVCEVLSPSTRALDLGGKKVAYARERVAYLWLVDPDARSLEAFTLHGTEWVLMNKLFDDAPVSLPPFEAISFNLGDLWPPHAVHKETPPIKQAVRSETELAETSK